MHREFVNWAGQQRCRPAAWERPASEDALRATVAAHAAAGRTVRAVGSGHSFSDIVLTDGALIDLSALDRVISVDAAACRVRVQPGITINALAQALHAHGLALENQGDVDTQALGGALATGTHGTGERFANLSSRMVGGRLVTATGDVVDLGAEPDPDVLRAARVSLGALGVLSEIELDVVPAFRIRRVETVRPLADVLANIDELVATYDHLEFYALPYSSKCLLLASDRTDAPADPPSAWKTWLTDELIANHALAAVQRTSRRFPRTVPALGRLTGALASGSVRVDDSHRVYAFERRVRFTEMEQAVPREHLAALVTGVLGLIEERRLPVNFPIEVRCTAPDDALLSTAEGRDTAYVATHQFEGAPYEEYFAAAQALGATLDARPHWGKRHTLTAAELAPRYPRTWDRFAEVRARLDPAGTFANAYVERVLGRTGAPAAVAPAAL